MKQHKTVFVTGGMSGLGKALASEYLRRGSDVAIFDLALNDEVLLELEEIKQRDSQNIVAYAANVADFEALNSAVEQAVEAIGRPELAINCAGIQRAQPFEQLPREDFELVFKINVFGSRNFAEAVLPRMHRGARLALVSSMAGFAASTMLVSRVVARDVQNSLPPGPVPPRGPASPVKLSTSQRSPSVACATHWIRLAQLTVPAETLSAEISRSGSPSHNAAKAPSPALPSGTLGPPYFERMAFKPSS